MGIERWNPKVELSKQETIIVGHLKRVRTLLVFLRTHRHEIIDEKFQDELAGLYRDTGAGRVPIAPGLMAMATLVQGYLNVSDAELVRLTALDASVQMVLDCVGTTDNVFSQGAFADFRQRFVRADMDRRLLERTIEIAKATKEFDWKKLPKNLRVAMDSAPLEGASRVEDTFNLLGHAGRKIVDCAAGLLKWSTERVCKKAGCPLLMESSIKKALDVNWGDDDEKQEALNRLLKQLDALSAWLSRELPAEINKPPLDGHVETLAKIRDQNIEPDPDGGGQRIREGVAPDRRVSIEDADMRHGRKNRNKVFNGYKQHLSADLDTDLILSAALVPANRQEAEAVGPLLQDIESQGLIIGEMYVDRGYISSEALKQRHAAGAGLYCKPHDHGNGDLFAKSAFDIDMRAKTISCPGGQVKTFTLGQKVQFEGRVCAKCPVREMCTSSKNGRAVLIAVDEPLQHQLRKQLRTRAGRAKLRERTKIEHRLAHLVRRTGKRARYVGLRKNLFAVRRAAAIQNLETIRRKQAA